MASHVTMACSSLLHNQMEAPQKHPRVDLLVRPQHRETLWICSSCGFSADAQLPVEFRPLGAEWLRHFHNAIETATKPHQENHQSSSTLKNCVSNQVLCSRGHACGTDTGHRFSSSWDTVRLVTPKRRMDIPRAPRWFVYATRHAGMITHFSICSHA